MAIDPYVCSWCARAYVVRELARDCERRHEVEGKK